MNWEQSKRVAQEYAKLLFKIAENAFSIPLVDRERFLELWSWQIAERMVLQRLHDTARTWRQASREVMRGQYIHSLLQNELEGPIGERVRELIAENAQLIRTLPSKVAEQAAQEQARRAQAGERPYAEPSLLKYIARWQAQRIARTETAKAQTALTQARSEELGLDWAVWRTSEDERVRLSHRKMATVLFRWTDQPSPEALVGERSYGKYPPGGIFNCRCFAEPLLRTSQVSWPHRCYLDGAIRSVTLSAFRAMNNLGREDRIAA